MDAIFIELPTFERHRQDYLDDDGYRLLQEAMMQNPLGGAVVQETGGLRKLRHEDRQRGKGKRGGLRVLYYYWAEGPQFWMFTLYDKGEVSDLTPRQRNTFKDGLKSELKARQKP